MKRVVIISPYHVEIEDAKMPSPTAGELLVRTLVTGIAAGTEINLYRGTNPDLVLRRWGPQWKYPMYPGLESVGIVIEHGEGITEPELGTRILSYGSHAEYVTIQPDRAVALPDNLDDETATLGVFGATSLHGVRRAGVEFGDAVAVVGMGLIGQFAVQHARANGADMTFAVDPDPWRLELARSLGDTITINPDKEDVEKVILERTGVGADAVIETAGVPSAIPLSLKLARSGGHVSIVGWHLKPVELVLAEDFLYKELNVYASRGSGLPGEPAKEMTRWTAIRNRRMVIQHIADGRLQTHGLVTHVMPYADAADAYHLVDKKTEPSMQVILRWFDH